MESMGHSELSAVTGAFGFSGRYITGQLLGAGQTVRTLTNHPDSRSPLRARVEIAPLDFQSADGLVNSLHGVSTLFNTYWVRFAYGDVNHDTAIENSRRLIRAAERAGVRRIVHLSITNPALNSSLPYFRGKAEVEEAIRASRLSYAILRPAVLFGTEDILINNIAWLLRRYPIFAVPGRGDYGLQPIFVGDLAEMAVDAGRSRENIAIDAVGPEIYRYEDLVRLIRSTIRSRSLIMHLPPAMVRVASWFLERVVDDVVLTKDEITGLMADLLVSKQEPTGKTSLRSWLQAHHETVGRRYASELNRHYRS